MPISSQQYRIKITNNQPKYGYIKGRTNNNKGTTKEGQMRRMNIIHSIKLMLILILTALLNKEGYVEGGRSKMEEGIRSKSEGYGEGISRMEGNEVVRRSNVGRYRERRQISEGFLVIKESNMEGFVGIRLYNTVESAEVGRLVNERYKEGGRYRWKEISNKIMKASNGNILGTVRPW
jgi:hypothetical protein